MCMICGRNLCAPGCPMNKAPRRYKKYCSRCGEPIFLGDDYFLMGDRRICEECISGMRVTAGDCHGN